MTTLWIGIGDIFQTLSLRLYD